MAAHVSTSWPLRCGLLLALLLLGNWLYWRLTLPQRLVMDGNSIPAYRRVAHAFKELVESREELGASLAVYEAGDPVLEMLAGYADLREAVAWKQTTLAYAMSVCKAVAAVCVARLVDQGRVSYEEPVAKYWPEFAAAGKSRISVLQLMSHQVGLLSLDRPVTLEELESNADSLSDKLARQAPQLPIGTVAYHSMTYGLYVDQLVRRVDPKRRSLASYFSEEIARPAGIDAHIGLPHAQYHRLARVHLSLAWNFLVQAATLDVASLDLTRRLLLTPVGRGSAFGVLDTPDFYVSRLNDPDVAALPFASVNLVTSAPHLARLFSLLSNDGMVGNVRVLSSAAVRLLVGQEGVVSTRVDPGTGLPYTFGRGIMRHKSPLNTTMFGHLGFGGQMVWSDPETGVTVAYLTNHIHASSPGRDSTHRRLLNAIYAVVAERRRKSE